MQAAIKIALNYIPMVYGTMSNARKVALISAKRSNQVCLRVLIYRDRKCLVATNNMDVAVGLPAVALPVHEPEERGGRGGEHGEEPLCRVGKGSGYERNGGRGCGD